MQQNSSNVLLYSKLRKPHNGESKWYSIGLSNNVAISTINIGLIVTSLSHVKHSLNFMLIV